MAKTHLNVSLDPDLAQFARQLAAENQTTVAGIFTQYLLALKRRQPDDAAASLLSQPDFQEALQEVQQRLQTGETTWHSFDEAFA